MISTEVYGKGVCQVVCETIDTVVGGEDKCDNRWKGIICHVQV